MRIVPLLMVALLAGSTTAPTAAHACGPLAARLPATSSATVHWTWGSPATTTVNQDFMGPGLYTQTLSVSGLSGSYSGIDFVAQVLGEYPVAWTMLFVPPYLDCQGHAGFSFMPGVTGTEAIPGSTLNVLSQMPVCSPSNLSIVVTVSFNPPFTFDPSKRYGIATLSFDHTDSVVGAGDATHCGGADVGLCFELYSGVGTLDMPALTWQHGACPGITKTRTSTWGALKQYYH